MTPRPTRTEALTEAQRAAARLIEALIVLNKVTPDTSERQGEIEAETTAACLKVQSLD